MACGAWEDIVLSGGLLQLQTDTDCLCLQDYHVHAKYNAGTNEIEFVSQPTIEGGARDMDMADAQVLVRTHLQNRNGFGRPSQARTGSYRPLVVQENTPPPSTSREDILRTFEEDGNARAAAAAQANAHKEVRVIAHRDGAYTVTYDGDTKLGRVRAGTHINATFHGRRLHIDVKTGKVTLDGQPFEPEHE